ncbi:hypothetical protein Q7P37_000399 [Cladosporium fusiforme]
MEKPLQSPEHKETDPVSGHSTTQEPTGTSTSLIGQPAAQKSTETRLSGASPFGNSSTEKSTTTQLFSTSLIQSPITQASTAVVSGSTNSTLFISPATVALRNTVVAHLGRLPAFLPSSQSDQIPELSVTIQFADTTVQILQASHRSLVLIRRAYSNIEQALRAQNEAKGRLQLPAQLYAHAQVTSQYEKHKLGLQRALRDVEDAVRVVQLNVGGTQGR